MIEADHPIGGLGAADARARPGGRERGPRADGLLQETATIGVGPACWA